MTDREPDEIRRDPEVRRAVKRMMNANTLWLWRPLDAMLFKQRKTRRRKR
jgi:hypothetical protein